MQRSRVSVKFVLLFIFGLLSIINTGCGCTRIGPGYAGIKVDMYGSQKGVEDYPLQTGMVWYNPITTEVHKFPTFMQQAAWTKDVTEGSPTDESVTFNSIEGSSVNVDVSLQYQIEPSKIPHIFVKIRQDADNITHVYMRSKVRDAMNRHASTMKVTDIFGAKKEQLLKDVKSDLDKTLKEEGFNIDMISFISKFRVDPGVEQSINMTIQASQKAIEAENKVKQSKAEADQAIEVARGKAKAIIMTAEANAEANALLTKSLTPELVQYQALQKWDGRLPTVTGTGAMPFIDIKKEEK